MIKETIETLLTKAKEIARMDTVIGEPVLLDGVSLIPISKVTVGFGIGGLDNDTDSKKKKSEAATGAVQITPIAVIAVSEGKSKLLMLEKNEQSMSKLIDLVPDILDRFAPRKTKNEGE